MQSVVGEKKVFRKTLSNFKCKMTFLGNYSRIQRRRNKFEVVH